MFTGLVESVGEIKKAVRRGAGLELIIHGALQGGEPVIGESIAVDGACLTVTRRVDKGFAADVSPETLQRTTLGMKKPGDRVNLERALRLSDRLGGHFVTGHIDGTGTIRSIEPRGGFTRIRVTGPAAILKYVIEKGCVAVDGISLTVNTCDAGGFDLMVIPHTLAQTTLPDKRPGDPVNIENDIIAKYVEKFLSNSNNKGTGITMDMLQRFDAP